MKVLVDSVLTTYELRSVDVLQTLRTDKEVPSEGTLNIEGRYYGQVEPISRLEEVCGKGAGLTPTGCKQAATVTTV